MNHVNGDGFQIEFKTLGFLRRSSFSQSTANSNVTTDQFIKMWNGVQVHGFLIKVKHAVGDEEWQRRSKKAEAKLAELTKKVEKVEELRSAVEEAKTENLYGKLEEEKSLHSQAAPKLQELDAMEEQLRELQGEREERSPVL